MKNTVILGVGNLLFKDDSIGVRVLQELEKELLPKSITLIEGGAGGLDLLNFFIDYASVIVIDAIAAGNSPGTLYHFSADTLMTVPGARLSLHDLRLLEVYHLSRLLGSHSRVIIIGIEPAETGFGLELSPEVSAKIPELVRLVKAELLPGEEWTGLNHLLRV
ncbi:MAG TPA: HyaD/HybD family hydrogenase maturation endopeptidase [Bacillota bacterium]|nr:HyaD/HybD family hydrogenase maturation endopeptidase [Bacillota bacterium]